MEEKKLIECTFRDIEEEMRKYNPDFKKLSVSQIAASPERYHLFSTKLDDHFTILLRSQSLEAVSQARLYLSKCGFEVYGNMDLRGMEEVRKEYDKKKLPPSVVDETMRKVLEYLHLDLSNEKDIGQNEEKDYFFYFYPIKKDVPTWTEFKRRDFLDNLNTLAKKYSSSIDLIFSQLDNVIYGGLKIPGVAKKEYHDAFFEACNVQINRTDQRMLYIACRNLMELVSEEKELSEIGFFQMYLVDKEIFVEEKIEEIYLDFPNELMDDSFLSK